MSPRLSQATLAGTKARLPGYDRAGVTPGIVHLGVGNFHRAHQAACIDDLLADDPSWGIIGVSLRRGDMRAALTPQDGLYTLAASDADGLRPRVVGSLLDVLTAGGQGAAVFDAMCDPRVRIVTLSITEKGYCLDPAGGGLDPDHADIRGDLAGDAPPRSAPGLLVAALRARRAVGIAPFTCLSCDNLPGNGRVLRRVVAQFARLTDADLADWIEQEVAFPSCVVDRITPATTDADRARIARVTGRWDSWPVICEPFSQWVIEDRFPTGRPAFEAAGVQMVADITPYETMKLRMLNGAHSTLAYLARLGGQETVAEAMATPSISRAVARVMAQAGDTLTLPGPERAAYAKALQVRFANPALAHKTLQIAMDGSQKIGPRLLAPIRDARAAGGAWDALALGVAAWLVHVISGPVDDPAEPQLARLRAAAPEAEGRIAAVLREPSFFGDLAGDAAFAGTVGDLARGLHDKGLASLDQAG